MRRTGTLWALAFAASWGLAASPAPAAAGEAGGLIHPGKGVGGISLGMAVGDLLRLWGLPERTERDPDGIILYDYGNSRGVGVFVAGDRVSQMLVVTPDWATPNGVRVGAKRPEVVAFFGRPDEQLGGASEGEFRYVYRRRGLAFTFKDRAVAGVTVIPAEAEEAPPEPLPGQPEKGREPFFPTPGSSPAPRY